ncbi:MAG TPA: YdcF family protein [Acidimicrobiales bacterium]|nr:YdcF family protein [Acidimicrobiales bacterium]
MLRRVVKVGAALVAVLLLYLAVTFVQVWQASGRDQARPVQAIVVFGAAQYDGRPSPVLRARLDHALALYKRGLADKVVVTGGRRAGDRFTEATVSAVYLGKRGVPDSALLREVSGRNSWQSLASAAKFLKQRDPPITKVLLVSDGYHAARIAAIAKELGLEAHTSPARGSSGHGAAKLVHLSKETVAVAAGRLFGFRRVAGIDRSLARDGPVRRR